MKIGNYQIGRYHAIIKKHYADGSIEYDTSFSDQRDLYESVKALSFTIGHFCGILTYDPKIIIGMEIIRGKEKITQELIGKQEG